MRPGIQEYNTKIAKPENGCKIYCLISAFYIAVARPEKWTPDILPQIGFFH
jgi:hypothetical protein